MTDNAIHLNEFKSTLANRNHSIGSPNKGQSKDWTGNQQVLEETGQAGPKLARWQPYLLLPLYKDLSLHKACQVWLLLPWRRQVLLSKPWHRAKAAPLSKVLSLASLFHIILLCETCDVFIALSVLTVSVREPQQATSTHLPNHPSPTSSSLSSRLTTNHHLQQCIFFAAVKSTCLYVIIYTTAY